MAVGGDGVVQTGLGPTRPDSSVHTLGLLPRLLPLHCTARITSARNAAKAPVVYEWQCPQLHARTLWRMGLCDGWLLEGTGCAWVVPGPEDRFRRARETDCTCAALCNQQLLKDHQRALIIQWFLTRGYMRRAPAALSPARRDLCDASTIPRPLLSSLFAPSQTCT